MFQCPFHSCLSHFRTGALHVSPFFSPLSLRRGVVVVCFEVIKGESLCHSAYAMWSRDPGWGDPWFPHGVVLLLSPVCMALCVFVFPFALFVFLLFGHNRMWWHNAAITCMNPPKWTGCQSFLCVRFLACSGLLFGFVCCLVLFCVSLLFAWFMMMTAQWTYVQVLLQFSFAALNSRSPGTLICITAHAMSYSVINDLAKAMKALDGKNLARGAGPGAPLQSRHLWHRDVSL